MSQPASPSVAIPSVPANNSNNAAIPDAPLTMIINPYLDELTANIRKNPISWSSYQRASLISQKELDEVAAFEKSGKEGRAGLLKQRGSEIVLLLITLLQKLAKLDTIQYVLVMLDDILNDDEDNADIFHSLYSTNPELPFQPFLKLLTKEDEFVQLKTCKILTVLFSSLPHPLPKTVEANDYFAYIVSSLSSSNANVVDLAVQYLQSVLASVEMREPFWNCKNGAGVQALITIIKKSNPNPQMQYQIIYCFWLLTYVKSVAAEINRKFDIVGPTLDTAKAAIKEKVIRVSLATWRNLLSKSPETNVNSMIGNKVLNFLETLSQRKFSDNEIIDDLEYLKHELKENLVKLSSYEEYSAEVRSGRLEWSPAHTSELFWKQNANKLNEKDYELLRILARILSTATTPLVLAVAAHDVGQYVKYCPNGKKLLQEIGAKQRIMELMSHEDNEVRYQALVAVQKYMVNVWEF
ncbi:ATPase, V1 complex, subunit H [Paraphysoderma sedebokerense]|nr:ATPase, V1 complex, subunit H [Paraphysoderma sedebokerense]